MLIERELFLIWLYSESNSGWNWNKGHFLGIEGESPKQGLYPLTDVSGPQHGVVKHLTFISIWSQRARGTWRLMRRRKWEMGRSCRGDASRVGHRGWACLSIEFLWITFKVFTDPNDSFIRHQLNLSVNWTFACLPRSDWKFRTATTRGVDYWLHPQPWT